MKLTLKLMTPRLVKPLSDREKIASVTELANELKSIADTIANTGAREGTVQRGGYYGSFFIEG